jgi:hypothetical protein
MILPKQELKWHLPLHLPRETVICDNDGVTWYGI